MKQLHAPGSLFAVADVKVHVHHLGVEVELGPVILQVLYHGQDHGLILVIPGKAEGPQIGQAVDMVNEALHNPRCRSSSPCPTYSRTPARFQTQTL